MHILVTADTVGGVWTYTRELVSGLASRGIRITLVSFGGIPAPAQTAWLEKLPGVNYFPTAFRLEWMQDSAADILDSTAYLHNIIEESKPDLLHLGQFCYGSMDVPQPKVLVAHSDVMSWSQTVRGVEPTDSWARWYRAVVEQGLAGASVVIAPSRWMLDCIDRCYGKPQRSRVIYNGRTPALFNPLVSKHNYAASVGRLWDEGKQSQLLLQLEESPLPIFLAGAESLSEQPSGDRNRLEVDALSSVQMKGQLSEGELKQLLSRASIYVATSKYEPFGLAPLEAAFSRCALIASDIPSFREIWGDTAFYFIPGDTGSLQRAIATLHGDRSMRLDYANRAFQHACERYTADRMIDEYAQLYSALLERRMSAA